MVFLKKYYYEHPFDEQKTPENTANIFNFMVGELPASLIRIWELESLTPIEFFLPILSNTGVDF